MVRPQVFGTPFSTTMKDKIMVRDNYTCIYCGEPATEVDHIIPRSKGGITSAANGVSCCKHCNMKKKGRLDVPFITRGLFYLSTIGVNTDWVDGLYAMRESVEQIGLDESKHEEHYTELEKAVRILTECDISRSEICSILIIDSDELNEIIGEYP